MDTSVIVAWERGQLSAADWSNQEACLSAITATELLHGIHRSDSATRREKRRSFVEGILNELPVLPFDLSVARLHAQLWADLAAQGQMIGAHDLLIGATALHHGLKVATRNARDFRRIPGLELVVL